MNLDSTVYCRHCYERNRINLETGEKVLLGRYKIPPNTANHDAILCFFDQIIEDINGRTDVDDFKKFDYCTHQEVTFVCQKCGTRQSQECGFSLQYLFFYYIQEKLEEIFDIICGKYFTKAMSDRFINFLNDIDLKVILNYLPEDEKETREKLRKLNAVRWSLPVDGGGTGGGAEICDYIISNIETEIFGIILQAAITFGLFRARHNIHKRRIRKLIRKYLNDESEDWKQVSLEDIYNNFPFARRYKGNEIRIIKRVIEKKSLENRDELLSHLKRKRTKWLPIRYKKTR